MFNELNIFNNNEFYYEVKTKKFKNEKLYLELRQFIRDYTTKRE